MNIQDEIRNALKPLGDVVHTVSVYSGTIEGEPVLESLRYPIFLNTDDPDSYKQRIESLLRDAGLADILIEIKRNPEHRQSAP
jgi:hypothetical protein